MSKGKTLVYNRHEEEDEEELDEDEVEVEEEEEEDGDFDVAAYETRGYSKSGKGGGGEKSGGGAKRSGGGSSKKRWRSTDDDDDDDDEDDEDYGKSKKRRGSGAATFIDDEAEVSDDGDEYESTDGEEDDPFIDHSNEIQQEKGNGRRMEHPRWIPGRDDEIDDVAEFEKRIEERYRNQRFGDYAENYNEELNDVEQQALLPSVKDPKLWIVKCAIGREREAAFCLMQKCIDQGPGMHIKSAISLDYLKNYIYIEAEKEAHVKEACKGLKMLNTTKVMLVPIKEMRDVLTVKGKASDIVKDMWVRVKIGIYKGDLAKVVNVSDIRQRVMVKLIPRVDLQAVADKMEGRNVSKKAFVPSPRLINIDEARKLNIPVESRRGRTGLFFDVIDGKTFSEGFLYKTLSMKSINYQNIKPSFDELQKFSEPGRGVEDIMSTSIANEKICPFMKGDAVIVVKGDLTNLMGWVEKVEEDNVHIRPKMKDLHTTVVVNGKHVCKYFKPGDHVKVVSGAHEGATGMIIKVNSNVLIIVSDATKENIRVFADHVVDSSEVTSGVTKIGDYELQDLVMLDNMSFGVIIRLESEALHVLKGDPDRPQVAVVKLREIKYKIERRSTAQDRWNNTVSVKDVVKILMGPCKGKQGPVEHILKGILFIKDHHHMEHSGYICAKAQSCILMGGSHSKVSPSSRCGSPRNLAHIPPSPRRCPRGGPPSNSGGRQRGGRRGHDSFVGSTIKIRVGNYKGCRGRVVSVNGQLVRVELESQMKTVTVNRDEISDNMAASASFCETPQRGIGSETPMHRAQTSVHPYMTPTRDLGGETPVHSGIRTPMHDRAWDPYAATTPARESWEDGNPGSWGTTPQAQGTPRVSSNEASISASPATGSGWGSWGDPNPGSRGTTPQAQGTPLARSNEAPVSASPTTGSGWGNQKSGSRGSSPQCQRGSPLARSNESPTPALTTGSGWGSW